MADHDNFYFTQRQYYLILVEQNKIKPHITKRGGVHMENNQVVGLQKFNRCNSCPKLINLIQNQNLAASVWGVIVAVNDIGVIFIPDLCIVCIVIVKYI